MPKMLIDPDSTGSTPLMVAARTGNGDAVKMIMQALKDVARSPKVRQSRRVSIRSLEFQKYGANEI